jgi:hypothetical protein
MGRDSIYFSCMSFKLNSSHDNCPDVVDWQSVQQEADSFENISQIPRIKNFT